MFQRMVDALRSSPSPASPCTDTALDGSVAAAIDSAFRSLDEFDIQRTLGTGSYGRVLLVRHRSSNMFYALKKLRKSEIVRLRQVEHTNNECRLLQRSHWRQVPFVVALKGCFQDATSLYLLLEYVPGGELFSLLRKLRTLPAFVAQFYAAQVVLAMESLHADGILYRDLKPENLLLHRNGYLRMADFGFAKQLSPDGDGLTWTFCGTPEYLAPEIIVATNGYGRAADWWAVGVLIYEMLAGQPPFFHDNHMRLYDMIVNAALQFPSGFDPAAKDLVSRLLDRNVTRRLGVLQGGAMDVKQHAWFRGLDWAKLQREELRAPFRPKVADDGDASNFDFYPEEEDATVGSAGGADGDCLYEKFPDFPIIPPCN